MTRTHSRAHLLSTMLLLLPLLSIGLLAGCQPAVQPTATLPPATALGPAVPPTAAPAQAANTSAPAPATASPTLPPTALPLPPMPPTAQAPVADNPGGPALAVTILHTNDVAGEIDPCG